MEALQLSIANILRVRTCSKSGKHTIKTKPSVKPIERGMKKNGIEAKIMIIRKEKFYATKFWTEWTNNKVRKSNGINPTTLQSEHLP